MTYAISVNKLIAKKGVHAVDLTHDTEYKSRECAYAGSGVVSLTNQRQYPSEMGVDRAPMGQ